MTTKDGTIRDMLETLILARVFVQDCIEMGWDRASLGNLYAARDEIDKGISAAGNAGIVQKIGA